ncbi:TcfC E-set like domain-containing protein [Sphingomonas sediminicola]|uniref:TcfC E-set like domain-containing protein n=1 Tax=Sphingomonas sediminicola TaxID=386874 RepID=A0ABX6T7H2_9SPHN|nr:TcfC E-set like domain-containing protein [Sphingomonas sediminicola]QNP45802.1 TcfC E-set like domain-containing protein [Sphingomonas sediminicola]
MGFGFATQFDTRADADSLEATPLIIFLGQPARVEILVDNRLVTSGSYEAGNNSVDTSNLPDGSYPLVLRIREASGAVREERRFFVKNAQIARRDSWSISLTRGFLQTRSTTSRSACRKASTTRSVGRVA